LPLTITSDEFKKPKSDDDVIPSKLGEILLELKVTNFPEGQKEISFELEIIAEDDPLEIQTEFSCDCESTENLFRTERNPNVVHSAWNRNVAVLKCKSGEEKSLHATIGCEINSRTEARETIVFKVNTKICKYFKLILLIN
jgi:hypothetical protein